jgi:hypothetical protein
MYFVSYTWFFRSRRKNWVSHSPKLTHETDIVYSPLCRHGPRAADVMPQPTLRARTMFVVFSAGGRLRPAPLIPTLGAIMAERGTHRKWTCIIGLPLFLEHESARTSAGNERNEKQEVQCVADFGNPILNQWTTERNTKQFHCCYYRSCVHAQHGERGTARTAGIQSSRRFLETSAAGLKQR